MVNTLEPVELEHEHPFDWHAVADMIVFRYSYELWTLAAGNFSVDALGEGLRRLWGRGGTLLSCVGMSLFLPLPLSNLLAR